MVDCIEAQCRKSRRKEGKAKKMPICEVVAKQILREGTFRTTIKPQRDCSLDNAVISEFNS
jgi:hypothetical protein